MVDTLNFVYCFDQNYSKQAHASINSLLDNVSAKINLIIINNNLRNISKLKSSIYKHKNLKDISLYEFKQEIVDFPNLKNKHVSEATYYRLLIDEIVDKKDLKFLIYLDSDIICLNDPVKEINSVIKNLERTNNTIAARREIGVENNGIKNYFNAGVIVFDFERWSVDGVFEELRKILQDSKIDFKFWDQDILNFHFNGDYLELDNKLNFEIQINKKIEKHKLDESIFLHYLGNRKPWNLNTFFLENSIYFQTAYQKVSKNNYLIVPKSFKQDLRTIFEVLDQKFISKNLKFKIFCFFLKFLPKYLKK